jgi:hypothetical protein
MARQQSQGTCLLCKGTFSKASMTRHLAKCLPTHDDAAELPASKRKKGKLFHLVVEGKDDPRYWLHLEMPATTRLKYLDQFLRDIWLECCGHLSAFKIEGRKRAAPRSLEDFLAANLDDWRDPDEVDMEAKVGDLFKPGLKLSYDYDFGSTTTLSIKVVGEREGWVVKPNEIHLLARNDPPHIPCGRCHKGEAAVIDMENVYDESGWLCDRCAEETDLADGEMTLPVVNSPRTGVCGYTGT